MSKLKIALDAGHGLHTAGRRCMAAFDPVEMREWQLNDRIMDKLQAALQDYACEVLRVDDTTGAQDVALSARVAAANAWNADIYLSMHHNAGIGGGAGGGTVVYHYCSTPRGVNLAQQLYDCIVASTGLAGNRSSKVVRKGYYVLVNTKMYAYLVENGFMDSTTDTPIILTEDFAEKSANALVEVIVSKGGLKKNTETKPEETKPTTPTTEKISVIYQVWEDVGNRWLPEVTDLTDYAGLYGKDVCCVYARLTSGNIYYKVHYKGGKWLPEVKNREDYAGLYNEPIDGLMMKTDTGKTIKYAVHLRRSNRWLPFVSGYDESDFNNGYAGILGQEIDGIKIYIE